MSSENIDWLKKVKSKLSFDDEENEQNDSSFVFTKPKANAIRKNYTAKDLTGLQVAHDVDAFQAGQSDILVLADRSVLDDDEEESLVSMGLKEEARLKRLREVARHAKGYSGFKAYEEETEDSVVTLGGKSAKILQKYDFATSEFNDEPGLETGASFRIGSTLSTKTANAIKPLDTTAVNEFDTVQSAGIDTLNIMKKKRNGSEVEKEKKRAKKLAKTLFADEPEMISEPVPFEEEPVKAAIEDDADMQRIIAATRREHLKARELIEENEEIEPKFVGGKSFDTLIMSESIFTPRDIEPEVTKIQEQSDNVNEAIRESDHDHSLEYDNLSESPFSAEPLVRNGVASTLALLKMRGINLTARGTRTDKSKQTASSDIKLEYFDQFGNKLNSKEAYKELSRKFHGKGPGKGRLEKMKRRREETLKMESASSSSQSAIVTNLRKQQEETGAPYMILSSTRQQTESTAVPTIAAVKDVQKPKIFGLQLKK